MKTLHCFSAGLLLACSLPAFGTTLSELLEEAANNNPDIAAAMQGWRASERVPSQAATLPDPQVSFQQLSVGSPRPLAGYSNSDFAYLGFGISQDIPYPGKLTLRSEAAEREADMGRDRYEAARRTVFLQVKESYIRIASLQKTLDLLHRDQSLLGEVARITEARYRLGKGTQQDVLKAQLQMTKLLSEIAEHHRLMDTRRFS